MNANALAVIPPEQHDRKRFIGGSDIAGILGLSPWSSPVQVYYSKTREDEEQHSAAKKKLFKRGKRWEAVVGEMLVEELEERGHTVKVVAANKRYRDPDVDYFAAEIDFEIELDGVPDVNVELKSVHPFAAKYWGESDSTDTPLYYYAQGMWGLSTTRRKCCVLAPMFGADEIRVYPIVADEVTIAGMRARATDFMQNHVIPRVPPAPMSIGDTNLLYGSHVTGKIIEADSDLIKLALRYRSLITQAAATEAQRAEVEFLVKSQMRDAEAISINNKNAFTWKRQVTKALDQTKVKEDFPKIYRECVEERVSRVFRTFQFTGSVEE